MSEDMFLDPNIHWECEPYQILMLRAFAPDGAFTDEALDGFLSQVAGNQEMAELADALFGDDDDLIDALPDYLSPFADLLSESMEKAYNRGIRER